MKKNIQNILSKIAEACKRAGRRPEEVKLIAVTKTVSVDKISQALNSGITCIGENRVQELLDKLIELPKVETHFIGHLQTNKINKILGKVDLIHSVDSLKLAEAINEKAELATNILIQINTSGALSQFGVEPTDYTAIEAILNLQNLKVRGFMTIGANTTDEQKIRDCFRKLKSLAEKYNLPELSMGMSNDYEIAVEEGSTMVRLGSAIFGER